MGSLHVVGRDDGNDRQRRARDTYAGSLRPGTTGQPVLHPDGPPKLTPLLDGVLDGGHVVRIEAEPSRRTAPHVHDCDQVFVITAGVAIFEGPAGRVVASPGDVVLVPAGEPHVHVTPPDSGAEYVYVTRSSHSTEVVDPW